MDTPESRRACPYCAEEIAAQAVRCPHCRSRLSLRDAAAWHRDHADRVAAGVATAIAHATAFPVGLVRAGFVALTFVHLLGPLAYGAGWLLLPEHAGEPSLLERSLGRMQATLRRMRGALPPTPRA